MAKRKTVRIILDTNWYISASINRKSRRTLYSILTNPFYKVIYSKELLQEYRKVIARDKFRKLISEKQVLRFLSLVLPRLQDVEIKSFLIGSRDPEDNYLLSLALDGSVDYLITGDDDLLVIKKIGCTNIVRMSEFQSIVS